MRPILALFLLFFFGAGRAAQAATEQDPRFELKACPAEFPANAVKLSPLPAGWVGIPAQTILLTSADVILGPPTGGALIGKRRNTRNGHTITFEQLYLPASEPIEKWLACRYGYALTLAQQLPAKTDRCVVTYVRDAYNSHDIQLACHVKP